MIRDAVMLETVKRLRTPDARGYRKSITDILNELHYFFNNSRKKAHLYVKEADRLIELEKNNQQTPIYINNAQKAPVYINNKQELEEEEDLIGEAVERVTLKALKHFETNLPDIIERNPKAVADFVVNMLKMYKENS